MIVILHECVSTSILENGLRYYLVPFINTFILHLLQLVIFELLLLTRGLLLLSLLDQEVNTVLFHPFLNGFLAGHFFQCILIRRRYNIFRLRIIQLVYSMSHLWKRKYLLNRRSQHCIFL